MGKSHLTEAHRSVIAPLRQAGLALRAIGKLLGYAASTISRELRRNASAQGYCARSAQALAAARRSSASTWPHLSQALWDQVHALMLLTQAGPKQVALVLPVSAQAVYNWVYRAIAAGEEHLVPCLRQGRGAPRQRTPAAQATATQRARRPLSQRSARANSRKQFGHWEGDLVLSGDHQPNALLSLVERTTGTVLVRRVRGKTSAQVTRALVRALKPLARWVRSITTDNGSEFARWRQIEAALGCKVYASEPRKPWQRAIVEHTNGLLRQYFAKGSDAACLSAAALKHAQEALNHRPRLRLNGSTPFQAFYDATGVAIQG